MSLKLGSLVDDRYRITSRIGHGGMAEVYEAVDIISKKTIAIKLIREDVMKNPTNLKRFENEATIAASLDNENIVKVYNHGTIGNRPYIANEFIKGQTIKDTLDFRSPLPLKEAIDIMLQLSSALAYAHSKGIIHRDIKPQNIYYMPDGTVKLGDFGIAQADGVEDATEAKNEIVGSVHYLAPEISQGHPASIQSDIYSLGVTFFELITGHIPFDKDTPINVAIAHVKERFPSPKKFVPDCPNEIIKIINKCTKKNPDLRYHDCYELHEDLLKIKNSDVVKEKRSLFARIFGFK